MTKVYGYSDDCLEIEGAAYPNDEIDCYDRDVIVDFDDGTQIRAGYGKPGYGGVWGIKITRYGTAQHQLTECFDENADPYSDVFKIDAKVVKHRRVKHEQ